MLQDARRRPFRRAAGILLNSPSSSPEPEKQNQEIEEIERSGESDPSSYPSLTLHSHVELHKLQQKPQII